jgi:hypothetical protein
MLRQVEDQHFGVFPAGKRERALVGLQCIASLQPLAVHADRAARNVHICLAPGSDRMLGALGALEETSVDARVLMDLD